MKWKHLRKKESKKIIVKSEDCPQLQVMKPTIQTANQTSQRSNKQKGKLTSRQKMNLSSLGNRDISKFGNEKWKWTNEWLMWKVKVNTWTIGRESESEHMKKLKWKVKVNTWTIEMKVNKLGNWWKICVRKMGIWVESWNLYVNSESENITNWWGN